VHRRSRRINDHADVESAFASSPTLPDVSSALTTAGVTSGSVSSILGELSTLQGVAPGGSLGLLSLSALDNSVTTLNGGLLGSLLTPVLTLLTALNPAAPTSLTQTLADLQQIGAAPSASTAVQQAVSELSAALTTAGLSQLLSQLSGLTSAQNTSALSALAGVQSLPLGGSVPGGSLAPVGTVLSTLAGQGGREPADGHPAESAASTLNGSGAISPSALLGVIGQRQSASGSLPSPLNGVASALAAQLAGSTSLFGQLASVGNGASTGSITGALSGLGALPALAPGASIPGGSLGSLSGILTGLAGEPGVPSGSATTLNSVARPWAAARSPRPRSWLSSRACRESAVCPPPSED
jgi:hypothetical protein